MKFWIGPFGGALITGAYGMLRLGDQWNMGREHPFQASGTLLAYMLVGASIGLIISGLLFSATQSEAAGSDSLSEETKGLTLEETKWARNQALRQGGSVKLFDAASDTKRGCPVSHIMPNKMKVRDRVQRIGTQIEALQRALDTELGFVDILKALSEARSSINDLSAELVEDYIRMHADRAQDSDIDRAQAVQGLIDAMRSYPK